MVPLLNVDHYDRLSHGRQESWFFTFYCIHSTTQSYVYHGNKAYYYYY